MGCISLWPWEFSGNTGGYTPLGAALWDRIGNDSGEEGMNVKTKPLGWQQAEWGAGCPASYRKPSFPSVRHSLHLLCSGLAHSKQTSWVGSNPSP